MQAYKERNDEKGKHIFVLNIPKERTLCYNNDVKIESDILPTRDVFDRVKKKKLRL